MLVCRLRASEKRKAADQGGPDAKLPRSSTPAGAESSVGNTPTRTPTPTPLLAQQQQQGDVLSMLLPGGILRSSDPTTDVQRVLEVLVEHQHQEAVEVGRDGRAEGFRLTHQGEGHNSGGSQLQQHGACTSGCLNITTTTPAVTLQLVAGSCTRDCSF